MDTEIADLGANDLLAALRDRRLSPVEALDALADRIATIDPSLGAFSELCLERARVQAAAAERAYAASGAPRALEGLPFAAKDIFDTAGVRTAYGSAMFADHVPARDADAITRLRDAGAILIGKTQTHEFAWGITSVNEQAGTPRNPHDQTRIAGGSSGGSAVAVASGQVPLALGTDTGGSIRVPSSFCGCTGLKPTFGTISRSGVWPLAATLDHVGPMARRVADLRPALEILSGVALPEPVAIGELRVGVCPELGLVRLADDTAVAFERAVAALHERTSGVVTAHLAGADRILPAFRTIQGAEAVIAHRRAGLWPDRAARYGADVAGRLRAGDALGLEEYAEATAVRAELDARVRALFADVDVVVTPISAVSPPPVAQPDHLEHHGETVQLRDCVLPFTVPQDLLGLPACAVPVGRDRGGLPIAVQLWGPRGADATVLDAAATLEALI